jgi:hypothetical protein
MKDLINVINVKTDDILIDVDKLRIDWDKVRRDSMTAFEDFLVDNFLYKASLFESDLLDDINNLVEKEEVSAIRDRVENSVSLEEYNNLKDKNRQLELDNKDLLIENGDLEDTIMSMEWEIEKLISEKEEK